jgi:hypothetical protein
MQRLSHKNDKKVHTKYGGTKIQNRYFHLFLPSPNLSLRYETNHGFLIDIWKGNFVLLQVHVF